MMFVKLLMIMRVDVDPEEVPIQIAQEIQERVEQNDEEHNQEENIDVMASVSKRKKNNRKMPPGLKSCISSAHDGWRQVSRSNPVCKLTSVNSIVRIQRQSSPTSNIGKKRQLFRANSNHAPPTITDAPLLSSPPLSIIEESRQSLRTNIENDLVGVSNAPSLSSPASNVVGRLASGRGLYKGIDLDKLTNGKKDKLIVFIPPGKYFRPIGEHERKLASWLGYCARSCGPPKEPWNAIEARYRTRLWSMIQDYFDVSPESPEKWKKLEEMQKYSSDDERLQHVPEGLIVDTWKEMFKVFANEDFQALCSTNTNNRASQRIITSTGPTPFVQEEMQRIEKQPTNDNETGPSPDDVLKEVFGVRSGYVRGKGLGYKASTRGMACGSRNEELNELRDEVARLNACLKEQEQRNNEIAQLNARLKEQEERNLEFFKRFESVIGYKSSESQDMTIVRLTDRVMKACRLAMKLNYNLKTTIIIGVLF
ncbi:hypothetical protein GH714_008701 [Hevea brasiliensis]|uniref:Uncharacterized protein n=1 Tax=Hevea brasiliensis TaxID=3981 RepID=A0A6A6M9F9_HEVBR|nr:hypothetical protein GH714_008701 [Hevea brasiliensis]